jgi:maltooligosyltrehalose trehalohydrolase
MADAWRLRQGASVLPGGGVEFRVWAPHARRVLVETRGTPPLRIPLERDAAGEFGGCSPRAQAGDDYVYLLDGERARPDPVSRFQPFGVHGPSRVVDPAAFAWTDHAWRGLALEDYVFYELHTGTFTPRGTFAGVGEKLGYLRDLGVTAVELMPVAEFPGPRNWGYDGVALYAPQSSYGGPEELKRLVDACHRAGLAVVLDVVYNHLGPEGNYLGEFGPYFDASRQTPWGPAIHFDGPHAGQVRRYFLENALYWVTEYHIDALRLDAIHGIFDTSEPHVLAELSERVRRQAEALGRRIWLIAESDLNEVRLIEPRAEGGLGMDAQWLDDFHHAVFTALTGERRGYLGDYGRLADVAKCLRKGFVYDGRWSAYRRRVYGTSSAARPGRQFVAFVQNHDQVANASAGRRLTARVSFGQEKVAAALLLASPFLPLLFMGQEYGETAPFLYFVSHTSPRLVEAVRRGRFNEFAWFYQGRDFPDPQAEETFLRSRLTWTPLDEPRQGGLWRWYRDWLALRRRYPCLGNGRKDLTQVAFDEAGRWLRVVREDPGTERALLLANLGPHEAEAPVPVGTWTLGLWSGAGAYGGAAGHPPPAVLSAPTEVLSLPAESALLYLSGTAQAAL